MEYNAVLTDLPIPIRMDGCDVRVEYVKELSLVSTENELEAFTTKWNMLWRLPYGENKELSKTEESIVNNTYDKIEALNCIRECRDKICSHGENGIHCVGANILLPPIFLVCHMTSEFYGVPLMVALVQLQKSLDNLPDHVALDVF